jgi:VanZ family protein
MKIYTKTIKTWLPVILWICCIFILSTDTFSSDHTSIIIERFLRSFLPHITARQIDTIHFFVRKTAHLTEYFIMSLLLFHSFRNTLQFQRNWRLVFYSFLIVIFVAAADEFHQSFVMSRTSSVIDIGIDIAGGILGLVICLEFYRLRRIRAKKVRQ